MRCGACTNISNTPTKICSYSKINIHLPSLSSIFLVVDTSFSLSPIPVLFSLSVGRDLFRAIVAHAQNLGFEAVVRYLRDDRE